MQTPVPACDKESTDSTLKSKSPSGSLPRKRDWLPPGWGVEEKVRKSGSTAGVKYMVYIDPVSGRRFHSKNEVMYFLETGCKLRGNPNATKSRDSPTGRHIKKGALKNTISQEFGGDDVPERVKWVLTDESADIWSPYIDDLKVAEPIIREWAAAFHSFAQS